MKKYILYIIIVIAAITIIFLALNRIVFEYEMFSGFFGTGFWKTIILVIVIKVVVGMVWSMFENKDKDS